MHCILLIKIMTGKRPACFKDKSLSTPFLEHEWYALLNDRFHVSLTLEWRVTKSRAISYKTPVSNASFWQTAVHCDHSSAFTMSDDGLGAVAHLSRLPAWIIPRKHIAF